MEITRKPGRPSKERLPENVSSYLDRHGKRRYRYRVNGQKTHNFKETYGTAAFDEELSSLRSGAAPVSGERYERGTVGWVAARYRASLTFTGGKSEQTQRTAWLILEKFVAEFAKYQIIHFQFDHIESILKRAATKRPNAKGRMIGGPSAANNLRKELLPFFAYAIKALRLERVNPVEQADTVKVPKGGFHSWSEEEIAQYRAHHALGTSARLALEIFLWTAQRRGDASTFGPHHLRDGMIEVTPAKTANKTGKTIWLPVAPQLLEAIEAMPVAAGKTFLATAFGNPFTRAGLGNKMRDWCNEASLPHCAAHGLRKAAARRAAELGATNQELKAFGGWTTDKQVSVYTEAANQKKMAKSAMAPMIQFDLDNQKT
ncbi:integrase [Novosphingobium sp. SG751A]|uniref:tyrosine-type recombinase/integrase n=1 Tax=Novosphingobium sp. SG751A TaxID=2587000 RepID=UPI001551D660|nr:tyrosine-type recombinase/integrase [Novosphingobium sp. SG751A]NOW46224.1 integrase [Novosphingobium sp. SG751A]